MTPTTGRIHMGNVLNPFFTVTNVKVPRGAEYVLTDIHSGHQTSLFDGDDDYWTLANLIDRVFGEVK